MSTSLHYKSNLRDIFFNLFEVNGVGEKILGHGPFAGMDEAGAREILSSFEQQCITDWATSYVESDRVVPTLDGQGNVKLPESMKKALNSYTDGGWHKLGLPERLGGFGAPPSIHWAAYELLAGANSIITFYTLCPTMARVIDLEGTEKQKALFLENMLERAWGGTMVLTEPDAGSDVGAGRAKARLIKDDIWEIEGVKRFITSGDFDAVENIVHLVLARPEGAGPGTKGLSLFIVPKFWVNDDGTLGERNGAFCTNLEKKMGIKGSATCEMTFGGKTPCRGYLMGNIHDGIRQMFLVIEQARMAIGFKSVGTMSTAYLNALAYAKDRVQGPDLLKSADKTSPRVRIIEHPDVRRMLMLQKSHAEGMRALCMYAANMRDEMEVKKAVDGAEAARGLDELVDLLLPMVKGYCSEKTYELLATSLQCFGGSGFCQDYPIEQYIRDQKIDSLYEGTTHIQALDLIFRKILRDGGKTLQALFKQMTATLAAQEGGQALEAERTALTRAMGDMEGILGALQSKVKESLYHVGVQGNRVLFALSEVVIGWLLLRQGAVAQAKLAAGVAGADKSFYEGKMASVRFYCQNVLPGLTLTRKLVENGTLDVLSVSEDAF